MCSSSKKFIQQISYFGFPKFAWAMSLFRLLVVNFQMRTTVPPTMIQLQYRLAKSKILSLLSYYRYTTILN